MTHILVTNDDGVTAPGLLAIAQEMKKLGQVTIIAPDRNWSASGHVKTLHRPLRVKDVIMADGTEAFACDGAPSDCVALALLGLLSEPVDLVVSGINPNANLGHDVTYSGTVTAAMEAAIGGVPGIAVSLDSPENHVGQLDYLPAARTALRIATKLTDGWDSFGKSNSASVGTDPEFSQKVVLNVNVPYLQEEEIKGIVFTRLGLRLYRDSLECRRDPRGRPYYWIGGEPPSGVKENGTDIGMLAKGYVSVTPLNLDLTNYKSLDYFQTLEW